MNARRSAAVRGLLALTSLFAWAVVAAAPAQAVQGHVIARTFGNVGQGKLTSVAGVAVSASGDVYVEDPAANRVVRFTADGLFVQSIDTSSRFTDLRFITYDPKNDVVYVAGQNAAGDAPAVVRYAADGTNPRPVDLGQVTPDITEVGGIAADSQGRLYVADSGGDDKIVRVFSQSGTLLPDSFNGEDADNSPFGSLGGLAVDGADAVYALEPDDQARKFSPLGQDFLGSRPGGSTIAADRGNSNVFVTDAVRDGRGVTTFAPDGTRLERFAEAAPGTDAISGLAVNRATHAVYVANSNTNAIDQYETYTAPGVTTLEDPVSGGRSATLRGRVNPSGQATTRQFEYFSDNGSGEAYTRTPPQSAGQGTTSVAVSTLVSGLLPNTRYGYRIRASNSRGSNVGELLQFDTKAIPPDVSGGSASAVTSTAATLNASVNPNNTTTRSSFAYGLSGSYGKETAKTVRGSGYTDIPTAIGLDGLNPASTYHFRVVAENGVGDPAVGSDRTFTTAPAAPGATIGATGDSAVFTGAVNTGGAAAAVSFSVAGRNVSYSAETPAVQLAAGSGARPVSGAIAGLPAGGVFDVRVRVQTASTTLISDASTYATAPTPPGMAVTPPVFDPFPYGCAAPRLVAPSKTLRAGRAATLTGSDLGVAGDVSFGSRAAEITRYGPTSITVVVPSSASGRVPVKVTCGRSSNTVTARVSSAAPSNRFSTSVSGRGSTATIKVKVPGPGSVSVSGTSIGFKKARPRKAGTSTLKVSLTKSGRAALARAKGKRLSVKVAVRYRPTGGSTRKASRTLVFRR